MFIDIIDLDILEDNPDQPYIGECITFSSDMNGTLTSNNYPSNYPNNLTCIYNISIPEVNSIRIVFQDFKTEHQFDYLYFGIGEYARESNAIGSFHGWDLPKAFTLQSSSVWFLFISNEAVTYSGFSLTWEAFDGK